MDLHDISITILPRNYPRLLSLESSEMLCEIHNIDIKTPSETALYARNENHVSEGIADFPGKIYIRNHLGAMGYALNEFKRHRKEKDRMVFWLMHLLQRRTSRVLESFIKNIPVITPQLLMLSGLMWIDVNEWWS